MERSNTLNIPLPISLLDYFFQQHSMEGLLLINGEGQITKCNGLFISYAGYKCEEISGKHYTEIIQTTDTLFDKYNEFPHLIEQHDSDDLPLPVLTINLKNGQRVKSKYTLLKIDTNAGDTKSSYLIFLHDIQRGQHLNLLQQFTGTFLKDVNLGVLLINLDFRLVDISDMACRILGMKREEILNFPMEEVFSKVPVEHQLVQRTVLDGQVVRNHAISWSNDEIRYELLIDSNILIDDSGRTVGAYVLLKDVSNLRSLEEQVQRSDRLAMIGQIAAGTAHEIRNPLTSIKGFLQVLKKTLSNNGLEKEFNYTEIMLKEIDRINELVSEFLLLSKPRDSSFDQIEINTVLKEILPIINNEAILHGVMVQYEAALNLPKVVADRELLKQVCLNICKNGIESMVEGGILSLLETVDYTEKKVNIEIRDAGPGIPSFLIDKIFDPFFTTKEDGTGLGLSVCQRIIHDIGGTIRVSSKGFGTTFTISIPYANE